MSQRQLAKILRVLVYLIMLMSLVVLIFLAPKIQYLIHFIDCVSQFDCKFKMGDTN